MPMSQEERLAKAREARLANKDTKRSGGSVTHTIRAKVGGTVVVTLTRSRAIKAMCTECLGYGETHPKDCTDLHCPLYPFRGKIQLAYADPNELEEKDDDEEEEENGVNENE